MCADTCVAYTGPFENFRECPKCKQPRYDPLELARGRQLQAMWASSENAHLMKHRRRETDRIVAEVQASGGQLKVIDDLYCGRDYLSRVATTTMTEEERKKKHIQPDDMVLMFSIDGAQLYASKLSDCWFFIWILVDLPPTSRYKKRYVLPAAVVGGPKKPKNIDSFLFPSLYHLAALQREGLLIWD
ncbi:hypothetical protein OH76DRAFT_1327701, partial [Lentinus brumalis]